MEKPIEHDPQQYSEEWFNVAVLFGKEFELPNISSPPFIDTTNFTMSKKQPSFDLNESIEPIDSDQTGVWTNHFVPCKKPRSESVQEQEIPANLNKVVLESVIEDGEYKCFICNASFINGNALGGHMSSHAKQRKKEAITGGNVFKPGSFAKFGESISVFADVSAMFDEEKPRPNDPKEE